MLNAHATKEDAIEVARFIREELPSYLTKEVKTTSGRREYTSAVWELFSKLATGRNWVLFPKEKPKGGRGAGEYLVDFALFDENLGCRIACESDWGDIEDVKWAFDKLRGVKSDIKILIFEAQRKDHKMTDRYASNFRSVLGRSHHHHPDKEIYVFVQFDRNEARLYLWLPKTCGPMDPEEIEFEEID